MRMSTPLSPLAWPSSFPMDHMKTLGRLRSRRTRSLELAEALRIRGHHARFVKDQHAEFIASVEHSGVGGLCEVRRELQPISWSLRMR